MDRPHNLVRLAYLLAAVLLAAVVCLPSQGLAGEPCLLLYPSAPTVFRYYPARYELVSDGDHRYDPSFDIMGKMLWDAAEHRVPVEIYQAPELTGFARSTSGVNEFYVTGSNMSIIVDGFGPAPRQLSDLCLHFAFSPANSNPTILVDGQRVEGLRYVVPRMDVNTPFSSGFYSDVFTINVMWFGALQVDVIVYSDRNGNRSFDGVPCYRLIMEDHTVGAESRTWGAIKSLYQSE
jgi:hypothetical protein